MKMYIDESHRMIFKQQSVADDVLNKLFSIDPYAILAGGAPRDWKFNWVARDLDIFFYCRDDAPLYVVEKMLYSVGLTGFHMKENTLHNEESINHYKRNPALRRVFDGTYKDETVQLMQMSTSTFKCVVEEFALNICKVWYKNNKIQTTKDFELAIKYNAIVKVNELYADGDSYVMKIRKRFPDFHYYKNYNEFIQSLV